MSITLLPVAREDAHDLWCMQVTCFLPLLEKYRDEATNPAAEPVEKTIQRLEQPARHFYWICAGETHVGALSVRYLPGGGKKFGPLFVLPDHRGQGIAQRAIRLAEQLHGSHGWVLDTIAQEPALCRLYEKLGYSRTGVARVVNERMTLVDYKKE